MKEVEERVVFVEVKEVVLHCHRLHEVDGQKDYELNVEKESPIVERGEEAVEGAGSM